jgi:hypothetical protein
VIPSESSGTRIIDCCLCVSAEGSVFPIRIATSQRGSPAPLDHHLRPLITYSLPRSSMLHLMFVASDDATSGSVIRKAERISPSINGFSHSSFCSRVP